ncbi:hypothetical protein GOA90_25175 [Sinorhizobium meliloti]|nr:hypothetical protein [Sinorhizobium meliloti]
MQSAATGVSKVSDAMAQVQELEDIARAKEADNGYSNWLRERMYGENGFMTLEGRNAVDQRTAFEQEADQKRAEFGKGLTPGAAKAYQTASQARLQSVYQQSIVHTASERKTWFGQASDARVETFANDALVNFSNPSMVQKNIAAGIMEIRQKGELQGWDADTLKLREAEFSSGVHKNIALRIAQSDPIAANDYVKANAERMTGAHMYEMTSVLENAVAEEQSKRETEKILTQGRRVADLPGDIVAEVAEAGGAAIDRPGPTRARAFLLGKLNAGHGEDHIAGLNEGFATNLAAMMQDAPPGIREGLGVLSGYRSIDRQTELWNDALKKYGSPAAARKWVAPPGNSKHNHGQAVDIAYNGRSLQHAPREVVDWVHQNAGKYGLYFPMSHEPWHVEPVGSRSGTVSPRSNTVATRATLPSYDDIEGHLASIADPKVRDLTRKRLYSAIEAQNKANEATEKAARAELWKYVDQGSTPDQVPVEVRQAAGMAAVNSAWEYIEKSAKREAVESDEVLLYDMRKFAAMKPEDFAELDLNDYRDRLSKEAIKELTGLQTTALTDQRKAREEGLTLTTAFSQAQNQLEAVGITTTNKEGEQREESAKRIAQFQNALAAQMEEFRKDNDGRRPTQMDIQSMVNRLLLPVVIKEPGRLWGTNDRDAFAFEAGLRPDGSEVEVVVEYSDIPLDLRNGIRLDLERELGRKPSDEEVVKRYEEFVLNR